MTTRVNITLACWDYDRTWALEIGRVRPEGVNLTYLPLPVEETFFRMLRHAEFDVAEMSLSSYVINYATERLFIAIPVFPSRAFRHNAIYVNSGAEIHEPRDLTGGLVGVPEYQLTANVWIRGILADDYGLAVDAVRYRTGGLEKAGRVEKQRITLPRGVEVEAVAPERTLVEMLLSNELAAIYSPRLPRLLRSMDAPIRRLFVDPRREEERYFERTGIFPIMHTVVIRRDVYDRHPWLAMNLYKAFAEAKLMAEERLDETAATRYMLPWLYDDIGTARRVVGREFWPYGVRANEATLKTFLRYMREQGLVSEDIAPCDLFAPETLESYVI